MTTLKFSQLIIDKHFSFGTVQLLQLTKKC